jgi:hypothetical protein
MKLGPTQKPKVHLGGLSSKQAAFLGVAGLVLVGGLILRNFISSDEPPGEETAPVVVGASTPEADTPEAAPVEKLTTERLPETPPATQETATAPSEPVGDAAGQAQQTGDAAEKPPLVGDAADQSLPDADMILVARRPVELLAEPSADATVMFGFPAGRPFRVIGREAGFVQIQDEKSGARGWIDEAALAAAPPRAPVITRRSSTKPTRRSSTKPAGGGRRSSSKPDSSIVDERERSVEPPKRPGLFGGGGLFGGIFRN